MIRWMCSHMRFDMIRSVVIGDKGVTFIKDKMTEARLRLLGYVRRRSMNASARRCEMIVLLECRRRRGRPRK